jgi:hypothetical protein
MQGFSSSFTFLTDNVALCGMLHDSSAPAIFLQLTNITALNEATNLTLKLPQLSQGSMIFKCNIVSNTHSNSVPASQPPFYPSDADRLVIIHLIIMAEAAEGTPQEDYTIFISLRRLLDLYENGPRTLDWEEWGPLNTRMLPLACEVVGISGHAGQGMRYATTEPSRRGSPEKDACFIYEFCSEPAFPPPSMFDDMSGPTISYGTGPAAPNLPTQDELEPRVRLFTSSQPTVINSLAFKDIIRTRLPYRRTFVGEVPSDTKALITTDNLVLIRVSVTASSSVCIC